MAIFTTEDIPSVAPQQPVTQPSVPQGIFTGTSAKGAGLGAVADIIGSLGPSIVDAIDKKTPLDDFASDLKPLTSTVPSTPAAAAKISREGKTLFTKYVQEHPEYAGEFASYFKTTTGIDVTQPDPATAVLNQENAFFAANP